MTILTLNRKRLEEKIGKVTSEIEHKITMMGTPIEEVTKDIVSVEVFPNRPDLLSLENFARAFNQFQEKEGIKKVEILEPEKDYVIKIEKSVKDIRPYTAGAIVKGLKLDEEKLKGLIDLQEKMHNSIGRKRKKLAIGIYPLESISLPITFTAKKPEDIKFKPLGFDKEMNANQILKNHDAGKEYGNLLDGYNLYPVFLDSKDNVLSIPPIINSADTGRVDINTKEVFIEVSGNNLHYIKKCLNIIVSELYLMGGKVYSMKIKDSKDFISPDKDFEELEFKIEDIEKTLGIKLSSKEIKKYLGQMGIGYKTEEKKEIALVPAYRTDMLHWIDLTEEIAIAYGYENFEAEIPKISTIASEDKIEKRKKLISEILVNFGLLETSSFHLTTSKNIKKLHYEFSDFLEVENSKTERDVLRMDILTNLLQILSENSDSPYPQKIFEVGRVFEKDKGGETETGVLEKEKLAISLIDETIDFTEIKKVLDYLFRMLGLEYAIKDVEDPNYISGRVGKILIGKKEIGRIGEIAPRVLKNWKIKLPVTALEIELDELLK